MSSVSATTANPAEGDPSGRSAVKRGPGVPDRADALIRKRIAEARQALWVAELVRTSLRWVIGLLWALVVWVVVDQWVYSSGSITRLIVASGMLSVSVWYLWQFVRPLIGSTIRPEYAARSIERDLPELHQELTSYVTLRPETDGAEGRGLPNSGAVSNSLADRVVRSMGAQTATRLKSYDALPDEATGTFRLWIVAAASLAVLILYAAITPKNPVQSMARLVAPLADIAPARRVSITDVLPGDSDAKAGSNIVVSARVAGLRANEQAFCRWTSENRDFESELAFDESTRRHVGEITLSHAAAGQVVYVIAAGDATSAPYQLSVDDVPVVSVDAVSYTPPIYTGAAPHTSRSAAISAVDGTQVTIKSSTNRTIERATIEFNPRPIGESIQATAGATEMSLDEDGRSQSITFPLRSAIGRSAAVQLDSYRIRVWDSSGQDNSDPIVYPIRVIPDFAPEVAIVMPQKSPKDIPVNAQQIIEVHASDPDFGLRSVTLGIRRGIDLVDEPLLWSHKSGAKGNQVAEFRFRPADYGFRIGDVVSVRAAASDNRSAPHDASVEANESVTDAVEFRITAGDTLENDPQTNDGLTKPDDRPATDTAQDDQQGGSSGDGESSGAGGSSGGGDSSTQGESSDSGGQSGSGQNDSDGASGSDDASGSGASDSGDSTSGQRNTDAGNSDGGDSESNGEAGSDDSGSTGDAGSTGGQPGTNNNAGQPENASTDRTGNDDAPSDPASDTSGQPDASGQPNPQDGGSNAGNPTGEQNNHDGSMTNDTGAGDGSSGGDSGSASSDPSMSPDDTGSQDDTGPQDNTGPPQHDGEAFERIRDHLEQKQRENQQRQRQPQNGSPQQDPGDPRGGETGNAAEPQTGQGQNSSGGSENDANGPDGKGSNRGDDTAEGKKPGEGNDPSSGDRNDSAADNRSDHQASAGESNSGSDGTNGKGETNDGSADKPDQGASRDETPGQDASGSDQESSSDSASDRDASDRDTPGSKDGTSDPTGSGSSDTGSSDAGSSDPNASPSDPSSPQTGSQDSKNPASDSSAANSDQPSASDDSDAGGDRGDASRDPSGSSADQSSPQSGKPSGDNSRNPTGSNSSGANDSAAGESAKESPPTPPTPADVEYAKKATDMVLDYLEQTRDAPDQELMDKLNWTEDDLRRFSDRWQRARELKPTDDSVADPTAEWEETLKSLGLRHPEAESRKSRGTADSLRSLRDAGNRQPPPTAHRDAFDAFRRAIGKRR